MASHIACLRGLQDELHLMGSEVTDSDFAVVLLSSLPQSWETFTTAYLRARGKEAQIDPSDLISVLLDEDRRRKAQGDMGPNGMALQTVLQAKANEMRECHNCKWKGHIKKDCWAKVLKRRLPAHLLHISKINTY